MQLKLFGFLRKLLIFTLVLAIIGYFVTRFLPENYITPTLPYLYLFFFAITLVVHYILLKISLKKNTRFINYFMLLTFGKLIFFLSMIIVYALIYRDDALPFVISFFILYLFYTVFEVTLSLSHTQPDKSNELSGD
jgi:hypothetical protein